jgi:hypothetical protein
MSGNKIKYIVPTFFLLALATVGFAQTKSSGGEFLPEKREGHGYALVAYASGGLGYYVSGGGTTTFLKTDVTKLNPIATLRVMWHPDHLLRIGVETGYVTFYTYTLKDTVGKVSLTATPFLVEWSMPITKHFNAFVGTGVYFLNSKVRYDGNASSSKASLGWVAVVSYTVPLTKTLGIATELKYMDASETVNAVACVQVQLVWKFLKW